MIEMFSKLGNALIPPKLILTMVMTTLRDHVKHEIKNFDIIFHNKPEKKLDFLVYYPGDVVPEAYNNSTKSRLYKLDDNKMFIDLLEQYAGSKLQQIGDLDFAVIKYENDGEKISLIVASTKNEEKLKQTYIL